MSTLFQPTALVGAIALAMGFSTSVSAQDSSNVVNASLDTLVVTATRSEEKIGDVPARISIIEPQIVDQSPIAELPHLLMSDASIDMMQYGGYGQTASIFTRGTNSTHTLVLRDGVRLNTGSVGSASLAFIDTTDIKQIEVLKGPASVLYGTDAIGGVVQLVSKTPEKTEAFITGEIGEHNTYKSVIGADLAENGIYAQIRGQRLESDGTQVTDFKDAQVNAGAYDQKGFSAKFGVEKQQYAASVDYSENQGTSTYVESVNDANWNLIGLKNVSQDFKNEILNVKGRVNLSDTFALHARLSQFKDDLEQNDSHDSIYNTTKEAELYSKWQFSPTQSLLAGVATKNVESDVLSGSGYYAVDYDKDVGSTGYFVQHQYQSEKLHTQLGVRVEDHETFGTHTVGQAAARYQILPATSIYTNIGTAFRAPTNNDLYALSWGGNPELKPEESVSYEIGLDQQLTDHLTMGLSAYRNEVDNLITWQNGKNFNVKEATFTGGEFNLDWAKDELFTNISYAYVQPKDKKTDQDLPRRSRQSITLTSGLQNEVYGISASLSAKSRPKNSTISGYATVDVNAFWNVNPNVKLFTNIQNIGDVEYKTTSYGSGYYYVNGGRLASAGVTFRY
ncbi:ligand-gated channel protein [Acinetobacter sp. KAM398]|uniref:TonB-dependent receptor plug domain-containing protein n=1 Tax=unclassified Acinetobacter TaxID=196816 RepID=UPI001F4760FC|nr:MULTISPECIES: TonB-dependent receptor [unclassified Acinetobacter]GJC31011.1 ligand-gated channel protein [Acinetobacter sp. KAM392]GJC33820.1 ligand-gated channel protein [Acinetobacter sp. KAM393]GJC36649.1 ligand-gated channel protein [Acinetobacter sp. KAM394]GJC39449.1 ligand-gated channel protein [Acinetobacter sp. KAM395]GJC41800.1 ligand-gated channel protein [Acinetobacter sp. KAM396]